MRAIASDISQRILTAANNAELGKGDGKYRHRGSAVSRCTREMVLHAMGVPWTNPPNPLYGDQIVFPQGRDIEDRMLPRFEPLRVSVRDRDRFPTPVIFEDRDAMRLLERSMRAFPRLLESLMCLFA